MATITVASVIAKVQTILQDTTGVRWPEAELLGWLNDGQREIVLYKPNAYVRTTAVQLSAGTKQSLPTDGVQLIDLARNMGTGGTTPGRSIRIVPREVLDAQVPNWHSGTANAEVRHYTYSVLNPRTFYVYPPQPAASRGYVEIIYGALPTDATSNSTISVDDIYQPALVDYMLYRAYSKDSEFSADQSRPAAHQAAFISALTGKARMEGAVNPNATALDK